MLANHEHLVSASGTLNPSDSMSTLSFRFLSSKIRIFNGKNGKTGDERHHRECSIEKKEIYYSKWMNPRAKGHEQYKPTIVEHYANVITHGLVIVPSVIGAVYMSWHSRTSDQFRSAILYGLALIMLFTVSTLFHVFSLCHSHRGSPWRNFFHYCDRATIYVFIAASYTPWLYLRSTNSLMGQYMISIVWISAALGIAYQIIFHEKYKWLEVCFYVAIGVFPSIVVIDMVDTSGLPELALGGGFFLGGILFFKSDGLIPFAHAIWHVFVCMGAFTHYYAIFTHLIKK